MNKLSPEDRKLANALKAKIKELQAQLAVTKKIDGEDDHIDVRLENNLTNFTRVRIEEGPDKGFGEFNFSIFITAKTETIYVPLSIASGIRTAGFMYQIEGTDAGAIKTASVEGRGNGITQVSIGTLLYAKIPAGTTAECRIDAHIKGRVGQTYKMVVTRINYKLNLSDVRYQQYLKPLETKTLKFA